MNGFSLVLLRQVIDETQLKSFFLSLFRLPFSKKKKFFFKNNTVILFKGKPNRLKLQNKDVEEYLPSTPNTL